MTPTLVPELEVGNASVQVLANQLPEADALPDGFSEGPLDASYRTAVAVESSNSTVSPGKEKAVLLYPNPGLIEVSTTISSSLLKEFTALGFDGHSVVSSSVDSLAVSVEINGIMVNEGANTTSNSPGNLSAEISEKVRRFPVPLSKGEQSASMDMPPMLLKTSRDGSRVDNAEGRETANSEEKRVFDRISEAAKARKQQMKEVRSILNSTKHSDEKVQLLSQKYQQQVAEIDDLEKMLLTSRDSLSQANKQKISFSADLNRNIALRQKLESLCRELQRQNKILLEESKKVATEEQQKRQELSAKFHDTIKEVTSKMEEQAEERAQQIKENELLRQKLNHFMQQYELREQHFSHQLQTKSLEQQLLEVKLKQQQEFSCQEESKVQKYTEQVSQLRSTEQDLRTQIAVYGEKFEQFQETLTKSNEVFTSFKHEMEKMSQTIKRLEKDNQFLRKKCEKSDVSIIELLDERALLKKQLDTIKNQKEKLEALCRSLHAECKQKSIYSTANSSPLLEIDEKCFEGSQKSTTMLATSYPVSEENS